MTTQEAIPAQRMPPDSVPLQSGIFYPRGYLVIAFRRPEAADQVRDTLLVAGFSQPDVHVVSGESVVQGASRALTALSPIVRLLGYEHEALTSHVELARKGYTFMLVYAPSSEETVRVMSVVRRYDYGLAHKFNRFTIDVL